MGIFIFTIKKIISHDEKKKSRKEGRTEKKILIFYPLSFLLFNRSVLLFTTFAQNVCMVKQIKYFLTKQTTIHFKKGNP